MEIWNNAQVYLGREVALIYGDISVLAVMIKAIKSCEKALTKHIIELVTKLWILKVYRSD